MVLCVIKVTRDDIRRAKRPKQGHCVLYNAMKKILKTEPRIQYQWDDKIALTHDTEITNFPKSIYPLIKNWDDGRIKLCPFQFAMELPLSSIKSGMVNKIRLLS